MQSALCPAAGSVKKAFSGSFSATEKLPSRPGAIARNNLQRLRLCKRKTLSGLITRTAFICNASHSNNSPGYTSPTRLPSHCGYFVPRSNDYLLASSPYYSQPLRISAFYTSLKSAGRCARFGLPPPKLFLCAFLWIRFTG